VDWFNSFTDKASSAWDEITETGSEYVTGAWEEKKENFLSPKETRQQTVAALPNAQASNQVGQGVGSAKGINWQAAGVVVGVLGILITLRK
jgi:hypothetical protein